VLLLFCLVAPHAIVRHASLSLDPTSSATEISVSDSPVHLRLDLRWRLGVPLWGDLTMQILETVSLTASQDDVSYSLEIPNPSHTKFTLQPMNLTLAVELFGEQKKILQLATSDVVVQPEGGKTEINARARASDLSLAEFLVKNFLAKGEGGRVTVTAEPVVRVWGFLRFHFYVAKVMSCEVTEASSLLQAPGKQKLPLLSRGNRKAGMKNVGISCRYFGNA